MTPMLQRIYASDGGSELLDVLMKYLWVNRIPPSSPCDNISLSFHPPRPRRRFTRMQVMVRKS